jgi:ABC-type antimicrobial peptide transport system permease subunit
VILAQLRIMLKALAGNRLRAFLTIIGVVTGVAAVIGVTAVGSGAQADITATLDRLGPNVLVVNSQQIRVQGVPVTASKYTFTSADLKAIQKLPTVQAVSPSRSADSTVSSARYSTGTTVTGITGSYGSVLNYTAIQGRFINEIDNRFGRRVAVIGTTPATTLFPNSNPVGQMLMINGVEFTIIGLQTPKGVIGQNDYDDNVFIPLSVAGPAVFGDTHFSTINVLVRNSNQLNLAQQQITSLLRQLHQLPPSYPNDFQIFAQRDILTTASSATRTFTWLTGAIAAIALFVGGIGIMNIMLVAVTERMREIGIRKAIGASPHTIQGQFLGEATLLSGLGGLLGLGAGIGVAWGISQVAGWRTLVSPNAVLLAFAVSLSVGLFFGYYPAHRAARLDPIEALRHE